MTSLISSTPIRTYIDEVKAFADTYLRDKDTLLDVVSITERLNQASSLVSKGNSLTSPSSDPELFLAQLDAISIQQELNKKIAAISLPALTLATATSMPVPSERPALLQRKIPRNLRSEEPSQVFKDSEILKIYPMIKKKQIAGKGLKPETSGPIQYIDQLSDVYAEYTANGKAIIQQQSNTSSSAAAACMVILDRLGSLPESFHSDLFYRRGSTNKAIVSDIQTAGLIAATAKFRSLEKHKKN